MTKWKLVPVDPTPEMIDAWNNDDSDEFRHAYKAMLEAAPTPAEAPADVARDAERWQMLPAFLAEFQVPYLQLVDKIDAAIERQGGE